MKYRMKSQNNGAGYFWTVFFLIGLSYWPRLNAVARRILMKACAVSRIPGERSWYQVD